VSNAGTGRDKVRVLLLENIHPDAVSLLTAAGFEVDHRSHALAEEELVAALAEVEVLGIRSKTQVTARVLDEAPRLLAVGAFCIGTNQIDLPSAAERGIAVFNAPYSNTRSVVEMALSEVIALTRRLPVKNTAVHAGRWDKSASGAHEVRGRTLGIVGYGNIGSQLSELAESLGMSVFFYDTADKLARGNARRCDSLEELLGVSDAVTLHVDGRPGNRDMFGEAEFARMRDGAYFLNLSRGFVVDHAALRAHIESGHLGGAAVDVFPAEASAPGAEFQSELRGLDNVILTPHIAGSTEEAQQDIGGFVAAKIRDYVFGGSTALSVNLPNLGLPETVGRHRLIHIHRNVPGVLATINNILAEYGVNVDGQYLGTQGNTGYVITDIASDYTEEMLTRLDKMEATIRIRLLS
jgi:D-3-phosphoglycerate dehydrogenase